MRFRAMGTEAAPGTERALRPKWRDPSRLLQILSFIDFFLAALGQKEVCKAKGRKGSHPRSRRPFLSYFPHFFKNSSLEQGRV